MPWAKFWQVQLESTWRKRPGWWWSRLESRAKKYSGGATTKVHMLALAGDTTKTGNAAGSRGMRALRVPDAPTWKDGVASAYLAEIRQERLRNPRPGRPHLTLHGIPRQLRQLRLQPSTTRPSTGADTSPGARGSPPGGRWRKRPPRQGRHVHDREPSAMSSPRPSSPSPEGFIYNAIRKTMDQGQPRTGQKWQPPARSP